MEWNRTGTIRERRVRYFGVFLVWLFAEVFIALFIRDSLIRPYLGDILAVQLVYFAVRIWKPTGVRLLPLYVFAFACLIEGMQYMGAAELLGAAGDAVVGVVMGTTFDWVDVVCYGLGCLGLAVYQMGRRYYERLGF